MTRTGTILALIPISILLVLTACGKVRQPASTQQPTVIALATGTPAPTAKPIPTDTPVPPMATPSLASTATLPPVLPTTVYVTFTPTPPISVEPTPGDILYKERTIGSYTIRLWHPGPNRGMYDSATISTAGQPEIHIKAVAAIGTLPVPDVTGDGYPDVLFTTYAGGSHCCWGTTVYNLGLVPTKVLETWSSAYYLTETGRGTFQDLDGNGTYEFITYDPLRGIPCTQPMVKAILQYEPDCGYVGASPRFAAFYADDIAAHTHLAEEEIEQSKDGYKCGAYQVVADYLYSGQSDRAWAELHRLYLAPDVEDFRTQLQQSVSQGRFFVATVMP